MRQLSGCSERPYIVADSVQNRQRLPAAAANSLLISSGFNIRIKNNPDELTGPGTVVTAQSPAAGTVLAEGSVVAIEFKYTDDKD